MENKDIGGELIVTLIDGTNFKLFDLLKSTSSSNIDTIIQSLMVSGVRINSSKILDGLGVGYRDVILIHYPPHMIREIVLKRTHEK